MITKLSPEQEAAIPRFVEKWVNVASRPINKNIAIRATNEMYKRMGENPPLVVFGDSPLSTAIMGALFFMGSELRSELYSKLDSELRSELDSKLDSKLNSELDSKLRSKLYSELDSKLYSKLGSELYSKLDSKLRSELDSKLDSKLGSKLYSKLYSKLDSELYSKLRSELRSKLYSKLDSELGSELGSKLDSELYSELYSKLGSELGSKLGSKLYSELDSKLYSKLDSKLGSKLGSELYSKLDLKLYSKLDSKLYSELDSKLGSKLGSIKSCWYLTFWWLSWCGYYDYGKYLGIDFNDKNYNLFIEFVSESSFIIPFKGIAFISEKPTEIHWKDDVLHNEIGAAVLYKDGYGLWTLNGVTVTKEIVETPADELDPRLILTEKNAEIRREIVRKVGIERIIEKLGAITLDKENDYELLKVDKILVNDSHPVYLKMLNPSIATWHIEEVHPDTKTVNEAIHRRKPPKLQQIKVDDVKGEEWYQQGDLCIWPKDATSVKNRPSILT